MKPFRLALWLVLAAGLASSAGCAAFERFFSAGSQGGASAGEPGGDAYRESDGTYGAPGEVLATVDAVKTGGESRLMSSRAIRLPTRELHSITVFDYRLPESCGGYAFRVYESGATQILEYSHEALDGSGYLIRDYIAGTSPFMQPGLWSSYDHTADSVTHMMALVVETGSRLVPAVYSQGLVTSLAEMTQRELGAAYRNAVRAASLCAAVPRQPQDRLQG